MTTSKATPAKKDLFVGVIGKTATQFFFEVNDELYVFPFSDEAVQCAFKDELKRWVTEEDLQLEGDEEVSYGMKEYLKEPDWDIEDSTNDQLWEVANALAKQGLPAEGEDNYIGVITWEEREDLHKLISLSERISMMAEKYPYPKNLGYFYTEIKNDCSNIVDGIQKNDFYLEIKTEKKAHQLQYYKEKEAYFVAQKRDDKDRIEVKINSFVFWYAVNFFSII